MDPLVRNYYRHAPDPGRALETAGRHSRKTGFYIYAAAQLIGLFGPLMTVGVTALYGSQLKRLG